MKTFFRKSKKYGFIWSKLNQREFSRKIELHQFLAFIQSYIHDKNEKN